LTFDRTVGTLRWLATNGLRIFLQFWYTRRPMFWLPSGWVPGYVEWALSFPRAPVGSISIQIWAGACAAVIGLLSVAVASACILGGGVGRVGTSQPVTMGVGGEKKEL